ncbi:cytosolic sulfotransferase 1-like isoform X1 [Pseudoliparis swirei]|uniref:cytosolic sulfotransferase 1-like isoform X1 n=1 Tax=Pseudoliparis swirei TaxID=2059687 RepID=UPI0024BF01ED|nr:cytosolic sulfotransferase 1-like isoform X1 [Pseudoliparis swirei]
MSFDPDKSPPRPELFDFQGVSMTHYFTDNWENIQNFQARPDDILIATYPKAGTTWVSYILDLLYFGETERQKDVPIYHRVPFLEIFFPSVLSGIYLTAAVKKLSNRCSASKLCSLHLYLFTQGTDMVDNLATSPRIIKTHFPVQFVPKSFWEQNCRVVYVARNAKDNVVSSFHFDRMNILQPEAGDWSNYLHRFMGGKVVYGSWHNHVNGWWKKKQTYAKLHYMFYEDLAEDTGREIDKLCCFLGLSRSDEVKKRVTNGVHFDNMKKDNMANYSTNPFMDFKISPFMRKGKVGDWKNHFSAAQSEQFDEDYEKKMTDVTLQFRSEI